MTLKLRILNRIIKLMTRIVCRIDDASLDCVPMQGPLILVVNHINFLEVPVLTSHLHPRPITGFAKRETWDNRVMALLFNIWGGIPLRRGEADVGAFRQALAALTKRSIVAVAPEGTRSGDGILRQGLPGVVILALRSGAPILPVICYGGEDFWSNLANLRRTPFRIKVGHLFYIDPGEQIVRQTTRREIVNEIMYQMAALLPPRYRGVYSDLSLATERYLRFPPRSRSNLIRAHEGWQITKFPRPALTSG